MRIASSKDIKDAGGDVKSSIGEAVQNEESTIAKIHCESPAWQLW